MSYRFEVAVTLLEKDYVAFKDFVKTIEDEYLRGELEFDRAEFRTVRGIDTVTLFTDDRHWEPESKDSWAGVLLRFLDGGNIEPWDEGERPYKIPLLGEEIDDIEHIENRVDDGGVDVKNVIPYDACPTVRRSFVFWGE